MKNLKLNKNRVAKNKTTYVLTESEISNDDLSDNFQEILEAIKKEISSEIKYIVHEEDQYLQRALNTEETIL